MHFDDIMQTNKYTKNKTNTKEYIVIHHTGGTGYKAQRDYLCNNKAQVSCNYVTGEEGQVAKIASDDHVTRHAGKSKWEGRPSLNYYSIGIEVVSDGYNFTDKQKARTRELIQYLMFLYDIPAERVIRHKDVAPGRKWDIGDTFRNNSFSGWDKYQQSLTNEPKLGLTAPRPQVIALLISSNGRKREKTTNNCEKDILHKTNNALRGFMDFYDKKY